MCLDTTRTQKRKPLNLRAKDFTWKVNITSKECIRGNQVNVYGEGRQGSGQKE